MPWLLAIPALLFLVPANYAAIGAGLLYSFTSWNGESAKAAFVGLSNFIEIFQDPESLGALEHTLILAFSFVVITNVIGLSLAVGLHRGVRSRNFIRALIFVPVILSPLAIAYVWQFILTFNGPLNAGLKAIGLSSWQQPWLGSPTLALLCVLLVMVWQNTGLTMVLYLAGLETVPAEVLEAGIVDGARSWNLFRHVTFPLLLPATTIALTLSLIGGLRVFDQVIGLTAGGPYNATQTLATEVWTQTWVNGRFGYGAALSLLMTVMIVIFAVAQLGVLRWRERQL